MAKYKFFIRALGRALTTAIAAIAFVSAAFTADEEKKNEPSKTSAADKIGALEEELDALYSTRLTFNDEGVPKVGVGISSGQETAEFELSGKFALVYYLPDKTVKTFSKGGRVVLRRGEFVKANKRYLLVVNNISWRERELLSKAQKDWEDKGFEVKTVKSGGIQGFAGTLVDTRQYKIAVSSHEDYKSAQKAADELYKSFKIRGSIEEEILDRPHCEILVEAGGKKLGMGKDLVWIIPLDGKTTAFKRNPRGDSFDPSKKTETRNYAGMMYVAADAYGGLTVANMLDLERVLLGVLPAEIFMSAPIEAIKAQAVAARNLLLESLGAKHPSSPFSLCDTQHCQMMLGTESSHKNALRAANETKGMFLFDETGLVNTVYSALAGGFTESFDSEWGQSNDPSLIAKLDAPDDAGEKTLKFKDGITDKNIDEWLDNPPPDLYPLKTEANRKNFRWKRYFTAEEASKLAAKRFAGIGKIKKFVVISRGISGRIKVLKIEGETGFGVVSKPYEIRTLFNGLPSTMFVIECEKDAAGSVTGFAFKGGGHGHGVGMCQTGAIGMAQSGKKYDEILKHYYSNAALKKLY